MRRLLVLGLAASLVGLAASSPAMADEVAAPPIRLTLTVEEAQLVVETLGSISCQSVRQLAMCNAALALLDKIKAQAREQVK
jgi:hypothetical protein